MGTEYLTAIILWCGTIKHYSLFQDRAVAECRSKKIACIRKLKNFTTDDVIDKCLVGEK